MKITIRVRKRAIGWTASPRGTVNETSSVPNLADLDPIQYEFVMAPTFWRLRRGPVIARAQRWATPNKTPGEVVELQTAVSGEAGTDRPTPSPDPAHHHAYEPMAYPGRRICLECSWLEDGHLVDYPCETRRGRPRNMNAEPV